MYCARCREHKPSKARFCDVCGTRLTSLAPTLVGPSEVGSGEALIGRMLEGVYELNGIISRGATSVVYRGTNVRLGQPVAIKVLASYLADDATLMNRFEVEAKVQAKLRHPNIVAVQDFVSSDNVYAIVMEYFEGVSLDQVLYELDGPMDQGRIVDVILPVLDAIEFAHQQGIVHRDIKPSNILVARVGGRDYPKVMDFGIAKVLAHSGSQTAPGAMLGTLLYMSPEQCKALKTVDERSDIYSLGVTLYQMATGMVPFYAESAFDIMMAHVQTQPPEPRSLTPEISIELQQVILKALEKDPDDRFSGVAEMRRAIQRIPLAGRVPAMTAVGAPAPGRRETAPGLEVIGRTSPTGAGRSSDEVVRPGSSAEVGRELRRASLHASDNELLSSSELDELARELGQDRPAAEQRSGQVRRPAVAHDGPVDPAARRVSAGDSVPAATVPQAVGDTASWTNETGAVRLRLRVPTRDDWERFFDPNIFGGGIFCPTRTPPEVGTPLRLEITFVGGPRFFVRGIVTWRRSQHNDPRARAGVGVQVHPKERNKLSYVNAWVGGRVADQRKNRRLPVKLRVTYSGRAGRRVSFTRDLNENGIFVRAQELLDLDQPIRLLLMPPGSGHTPFELRGTVSRLVEQPDERGMGIMLNFRDRALRNRYVAFIDTLEEQFLGGQLPDEVIS